MKFELISELDKYYDVISDEDGTVIVEANRKYDYSFKATIEGICELFSDAIGEEITPIFDINNRKIFYANINTNLK